MDKRKAFNFYRSYFEVAQQLPKKHQLGFLQAILDYQFNGVEPSSVKGFELAWVSQKHSLDRQLEGYKHGIKGGRPPKGDDNPPPKDDPNQVEGKGQVQLSIKEILLSNTVFREEVCSNLKISTDEYCKHVQVFCISNDLKRPIAEIRRHLFNWLKTQELKRQERTVTVEEVFGAGNRGTKKQEL